MPHRRRRARGIAAALLAVAARLRAQDHAAEIVANIDRVEAAWVLLVGPEPSAQP